MQNPTKLSARKMPFIAGICIIAAFIAFGALLGVSSQGDSSDTYPKGFRSNTCTVETETLIIGYSSYYLPDDYEVSENEPRTPYIPVDCGRIPEPGMLNISIDLLYPDTARYEAISMRVVKLILLDDEPLEEQEILFFPAQTYPSGVVTHAFRLDETGYYYIDLNGKSVNDAQYLARVPIKVGNDWQDTVRQFLPPFLRQFI